MHGILRFLLVALIAGAGIVVACAVANCEPGFSIASMDWLPLGFSDASTEQSLGQPSDGLASSSSHSHGQGRIPEDHSTDRSASSADQTADNHALDELVREPHRIHPQPAFTQQIGEMEERVFEAVREREAMAEELSTIRSWAENLIPESLQPPQPAMGPTLAPQGTEADTPTATSAASSDEQRSQAQIEPAENAQGLVINIQNTDIREVLDLLSQHSGLNILASPSVQGSVTASLQNVDVPTALDAILRSTGYRSRQDGPFLFVGTPEDFEEMDHSADTMGSRIYRPNYVTAAELEQLITPILTSGVGTISLSSPSSIGIGSDSAAAGGDDYSGNEVILIRDYETVLHQIDQIILEVDQRPLQVAIEAMILSVKLDDGNQRGVNFELFRDVDEARLVSGTPLGNLASLDLNQASGLKFGFLDSDLSLLITALETIGDTNVVASPQVLCINKQRAEILIGEQLGYVSMTVTENASTQSVEFLEVGTQLRIRPFISSDGVIRMEVHPELSTGSVKIEQGFTLPDKEVTQVTTNIMCRDGGTIIIGGLIRDDLGTTNSQIPLLGSLPIVGAAFRQQTESIDRRELIVLITPRIVSLDEGTMHSRQMTTEFQERHHTYFDQMSPLGTRFYGQRYHRLALAEWNSGNGPQALRFANLSVHFDPQNRQAIALRDEIVANSPYGNVPLPTQVLLGVPSWSDPSGAASLDPRILDYLETAPPQSTLPGEYYLPEDNLSPEPSTMRQLELIPAP